MDQSDSDNWRWGYDMDQAIADFCQLYPDGFNASGPGANQGAGDDRFKLIPDFECDVLPPFNSSVNDVQGHVIIDTTSEVCTGVCPPSIETECTSNHAFQGHISLPTEFSLESIGLDRMNMTNGIATPAKKDNKLFSNRNANVEFRFESGSSVIEDKSRPLKKSRVRPDTGIRCGFPGCKYRGSFNRKHDLERHMKKHRNLAEKCPIVHCDRFFDRYDKLLHHLRTGHDDTCEFSCPEAQCSKIIPFPLINNHLRHISPNDNVVVRQAGWKLDLDLRSCPIATCKHNKKLLSYSSLQDHLTRHSLEERVRYTEAMLAAGYHPETLALICPVCKVESRNYDNFALHFEDAHMFSERNYARKIRDCRQAWEFRFSSSKYTYLRDLWYPVLHEYVRKRYLLDGDLHATKVRPHTDYARHRLAILRLWPDFQHHPLFDEYGHQDS